VEERRQDESETDDEMETQTEEIVEMPVPPKVKMSARDD
jgi:hypothetical protein